jgi:CheY-like chemotaxis protein
MGGEIGVHSEAGMGSTFWFTARFTAASATTPLPRARIRALDGQHILVVDDNATNRKVLEGQLRRWGCVPTVVDSAAQALFSMTQARESGVPYTVALVDHQMPVCDGEELGRLILTNEQWKATRVVLLTSSGQRGEGDRFERLGFAAYLQKPVTQRELSDCLHLVLAIPPEQWHLDTQPMLTKHDLHVLQGREKRRVLVAEDNLVNQKVVRHILERLGYRVDVVADGRAAVDAWRTGRYHLILMDCQMPTLDGYEAAREIRRCEGKTPRIPIIALTADAMKGANVKCEQAGMNGYLTKPINRALLSECLDKFLPSEGSLGATAAATTSAAVAEE